MEYIKSPYAHAFPGHLEKSASSPFYHTDLKGNLEAIVLHAPPEKKEDILERVFSDKGKTLKSSVKAQLNEIQLRESLDSHIINTIDDDICRQHTYLIQLENLKSPYSSELERDLNKTRMQLENNVIELEQEKRKEYLECWRDLMFLKKYLLSTLKDYWDLIKKREMLSDDASVLIKNETR